MEMERRNDVVKLAAKKASQQLNVDLSEAAHLVSQKKICSLEKKFH
jgi:hypothetical protein